MIHDAAGIQIAALVHFVGQRAYALVRADEVKRGGEG
jgi:hypothetical protein